MRTILSILIFLLIIGNVLTNAEDSGNALLTNAVTPAETSDTEDLAQETIFDDKLLLEGYTEKYRQESREVIVEMIKDETLNPMKMAAAVRVFREQYAEKLFPRDKILMERILWRALNRSDSPFVQVELMYTLAKLDRYRYFRSMVPAMIFKLDHYNSTVNELANDYLNNFLKDGNYRTREAWIVFNTLRKVLFLSRKRLIGVTQPDLRLQQKVNLLRWSIKILGTEEIRRLPPEVIHLF